MTPRPFYRSRLFWLGLPGLVFLLWGWLAYTDTVIGWRWSRTFPMSEVTVSNGGGQLRISSMSIGGVPSSGSPTLSWHFESYGPAKLISLESGQPARSVFLPWPVNWNSGELLNPDTNSVGIAHWCITLGYIAVWGAALAWWQRHKSRLLKLHTAP